MYEHVYLFQIDHEIELHRQIWWIIPCILDTFIISIESYTKQHRMIYKWRRVLCKFMQNIYSDAYGLSQELS